MKESAYLAQLRDDLDRWVEREWLDGSLADRLHADATAQDGVGATGVGRHPATLPALAATAISIGILTVIAANWSGIPGIGRLALLLTVFAAVLLGSAELRVRELAGPAGLLAAIATVLFGGGLVVVGQLYHTGATTAAFLGTWATGATVMALVLWSPGAGTVASLLTLGWTIAHITEGGGAFLGSNGTVPVGPWAALPVGAALTVAASIWRALSVVRLMTAAALVWVMPGVVDFLVDADDPTVFATLAVAAVFAAPALAAEILARRGVWAMPTVSAWLVWTSGAWLVGTGGIAWSENGVGVGLMAGTGVLAIFAALTGYGAAPGRRWLRGAGIVGFVATAGTFFLGVTSLLVGGLLLIGFGLALAALLTLAGRHGTGERTS